LDDSAEVDEIGVAEVRGGAGEGHPRGAPRVALGEVAAELGGGRK
jgi:hypothetical protein